MSQNIAPPSGGTSASAHRKLPDNQNGQKDGNPPIADKKLLEKKFKLYRAALNGNWEVAEHIFDDFEEGTQVKISRNGDTALHIAAGAKRINFVKKLLKKMSEGGKRTKIDLTGLKNNDGSTAFLFAGTSGMVEIAEELMKNNKEIAMVRDNYGTLPIEMAAWLGHKHMVKYLYKETGHLLSEEDRKQLFVSSIETDLYDVALQLLEHDEDLAIARARPLAGDDAIGITALHVLAQKHPTFSNVGNHNHRGNFKRCFNLGAKDVENKKLRQARQLVEQIWKRVILLSHSEISELIAKPRKLIFDAAERGNFEFLSILIREYPDLIWKFDNPENNYSIFHYAVKYRQVDIFKLIYEIGSSTELFFGTKDNDDNNILHLAGKLPPLDRLNIVSGPALQIQRELLWFKEVQKVIQPRHVDARNKREELTPRELFTKEHKDLRDKGAEWMKDTAGSGMVVAALIATVAFAAAITVPGGNNGNTGFPFFLKKVSFKIFAIADAISLVSSSISIMYFLSIFTSRYAEEDFLWSLPRKLRFGLLTLFISIAALMIVFSATYFIVFNDKRLWIAILVTAIASTPVIVFFQQHVELFYDVLHSTDSLFQKRERGLFCKEEETSDQRGMAKIFNNAHLIHGKCCTNV